MLKVIIPRALKCKCGATVVSFGAGVRVDPKPMEGSSRVAPCVVGIGKDQIEAFDIASRGMFKKHVCRKRKGRGR